MNNNEVKCYALEIISNNIKSMDDMEYIVTSFKSNDGLVGVSIDPKTGRQVAIFDNVEDRIECYYRINEHFEQPMVAFVIEPCYVEKKYLKKLNA